MEFMGVGYQELILIMGLLLVVVGPERLPEVAYQVGRAVRQMQRYARAVRDEFSEEIDFLEEQYKVVKGETEGLRDSLRSSQAELDAQLRTPLPSLSLPPLLGLPNASTRADEPQAPALPDEAEPVPATTAERSQFIF